ncbi:hypothetical protein KM043_015488 [Ampulex compressa]|nr:hypothetical protein KM043_015488 [Ampulex compressa]
MHVEEKIFSVDELKQYTDLKTGLYLSILGQVYDVTKGAEHYGPEATYHVFTGRDASLAFITGKFNDEGLTDDISILSLDEMKSLHDWLQFYNKNYIYKGKLSGRYYNDDGSPTAVLLGVKEKLVDAKNEKLVEEERRKMFPPCNVEWKADAGSVVWCSKKSGGFVRDWTGVPRKLFESPSSEQYRCACVKMDSQAYKEAKESIKEYNGCAKTSTKCTIKLTDI